MILKGFKINHCCLCVLPRLIRMSVRIMEGMILECRIFNCIGSRSIIRSLDHSHDPIALSYNIHFYCTADARYIAKFNAFASHNGLFIWCIFHMNTFSYAIVSAINLNFSVAQIFCRLLRP